MPEMGAEMARSYRCVDCKRSFRKSNALADHRRDRHGIGFIKPAAKPPVCNYCNTMSELVDGLAIYPHREDLRVKRFYRCEPCGAWVGCHPGTLVPLGDLANAALRAVRQQAHAAFDPLWKAKMMRDLITQREARGAAYLWLAAEMEIPLDDCHIGMLSIEQCHRVVDICQSFNIRKVA